MTPSADSNRAKIDSEDIECRLGAAKNGAGKLGGIAISPAAFHNLSKETRGSTSAERAYEDKREEL
jgi:hypothetical protein